MTFFLAKAHNFYKSHKWKEQYSKDEWNKTWNYDYISLNRKTFHIGLLIDLNLPLALL